MKKFSDRLKKILIVALNIFCALVFVACSEEKVKQIVDPEPLPGQVKVYCLNSTADSLQWENIYLEKKELNKKIDELCTLLKSAPKEQTYISAIPENVKINSFEIGDDGQLILNFSNEYLNMDSITEVLCRASVVKTLSQLEEIEYIEFNIGEEPLILRDMPIGLMTDEDFIDNSGNGTGLNQSIKVTVYLTDENGKMLKESSSKVTIDGTKNMEETVLNTLISGPMTNQNNLRATVNPKTVINKVRSYDGICYVDLDENFLSKPENVSDVVAVYSVVNTLCELPGITKVRITVNGSDRKSLGKIPINDFMSLRPELIETEKAGESTGKS
ncbi:MAG: GerMN domain-containing protein [Lachnospiraceae bacterium]|nr:GerMN domain-containing protein [Lachnospiraceae bacterium]